MSDSTCLPGRVLPFLWQMVLFSFDRAAEEVWVLLLCLKTSSEVMFDRGKSPPFLVMWDCGNWQQKLKLFFKRVQWEKCWHKNAAKLSSQLDFLRSIESQIVFLQLSVLSAFLPGQRVCFSHFFPRASDSKCGDVWKQGKGKQGMWPKNRKS